MSQKTKLCYLTTSPEKFQLLLSNGSSNMDYPGPIGKTKLATLLQKKDSSSSSEKVPFSPLDVMWEPNREKMPPESGTCGATATNIARSSDRDIVKLFGPPWTPQPWPYPAEETKEPSCLSKTWYQRIKWS